MTLSVGQLFDNDAPKTVVSSITNNVWTTIWAAPGAGNRVRVRQFEVMGEFTLGDLIEVGDGTTVQLNYRWEDTPIFISVPGEGWPLAANAELAVRHQSAAAVNTTVNAWGREEAV